MILIYTIYSFVFIIIFLAFRNLSLAISLYIAYNILVPFLRFDIASIPLSYNLLNLILLSNYLIKYKSYSFKTISPFVFLCFSLFVLSLLASDTPLLFQFDKLRARFMNTLIIGFIFWNLTIKDDKIIKYTKWTLLISILISGIYGILLMNLHGFNPYITYLSVNFDTLHDVSEQIASLDIESRLSFSSARSIQSTMYHPMTWALNLVLFLCVFISIFFIEKKKWLLFVIVLLAFNLLISGVRTGIAACFIGFMYYNTVYLRKKTILYCFLGFFLLLILIESNSDVKNLIVSIVDINGTKSDDMKGSSLQLRFEQLRGSIDEIEGRLLQGKGYDWHVYYSSSKGNHPTIRAFESLIFIVLCDSGIVGVLVWTFFFIMLIRNSQKVLNNRNNILLLNTYVITFLAYTLGTGFYNYFVFFVPYYFFLMGYLYKTEQYNHAISFSKTNL